MKKILCLIILISLSFALFGQTNLTIYKTYEEFDKNSGEVNRGNYRIRNYKEFGRKSTINFITKDKKVKKGNRKITVKCHEVWGFKLNGLLFRTIDGQNGAPMCVLNIGKMVYYENGLSHLLAIARGWDGIEWAIGWGSACYISKTIESDLIQVNTRGTKDEEYQLYRFVNDNQEFMPFFDCLKDGKNPVSQIRNCLESFEETKLVDRQVVDPYVREQ